MGDNVFKEGDYVELVDEHDTLYGIKEVSPDGTFIIGEISRIDGDWVADIRVSAEQMSPASPDLLNQYQMVI